MLNFALAPPVPLPQPQGLGTTQPAARSAPQATEIEPAAEGAPLPPTAAAAAGAAAQRPEQQVQAAAGPLGMLPPQHAAAMQAAMAALASGQHPQLLEAVSGKMGLGPDQLRQTAAAIAAGESDAIPAEVVQQAMQLQWALRQGSVPPMGPAAAAAVPPGLPPGLLGNGMPGLPPGAAAAAAAGGMPGMPGLPGMPPGAAAPPATPPPAPGSQLLLDGEEQQGCIELYRRAYGRHLDLVYPPAFVAAAALALSSGAVPFWAALLLLPLCFMLGLNFIVVKGGSVVVVWLGGWAADAACRQSQLPAPTACPALLVQLLSCPALPAAVMQPCTAPALRGSVSVSNHHLLLLLSTPALQAPACPPAWCPSRASQRPWWPAWRCWWSPRSSCRHAGGWMGLDALGKLAGGHADGQWGKPAQDTCFRAAPGCSWWQHMLTTGAANATQSSMPTFVPTTNPATRRCCRGSRSCAGAANAHSVEHAHIRTNHQPCDPQMLPWLTELRWSCMVFAALCIAFFALHYRSGGSAGALWGAWLRQ